MWIRRTSIHTRASAFKTDRVEEIQVPYLSNKEMWNALKQYKVVKRHETSKTETKARQIEILSSLSKLEFASRRQLQAIHCLGSIRNANRILKDLRAYCHVTSHNREHVYYLNKKGIALLGIDAKERKRNINWNISYCAMKHGCG